MSQEPILRAGLRLLIEQAEGMTVTGEASDLSSVLGNAHKFSGQIAIIALDDHGLALLPEFLAKANKIKAIVLTRSVEQDRQALAMRLGAMGIIFTENTPDILIKAIQKVHAGEVWLERKMMASVLDDMSRVLSGKAGDASSRRIATLTARERQVVTLIGEGLKNRHIAERLFITEATVRHHLTSIFGKLEVKDRCELVVYAFRHGLAQLNPARPGDRLH